VIPQDRNPHGVKLCGFFVALAVHTALLTPFSTFSDSGSIRHEVKCANPIRSA
jgi:hypothetical protein